MHIAFLSVPVSWVLIWLWLTGCCDSHISDLKQRTWSLSPVTNVPISDIYSANKISINFSSDNEFYIHCWHRFFTCCKILTRPDLYNSYEADVTWEHDDSKLWTPSWISIGNPSSHYVVVRTVSLQNWNVLVFCFILQAVSSLGDYDVRCVNCQCQQNVTKSDHTADNESRKSADNTHLLDTFARVVGSLFPQCSVLARTWNIKQSRPHTQSGPRVFSLPVWVSCQGIILAWPDITSHLTQVTTKY